MELREYAETIFFSESLEGKLVSGTKVTDSHRGTPWMKDELPHRPEGLSMSTSSGARMPFPKISELDSDIKRGQVLHFFANHELLALELMALALMRFPDADPRWRKTLLATMRDEQKHLTLYKDRMEALGVQLGEIPLNRFFWDQICTMKEPIDFTVRMSLTFEQANLDFSLLYRDAFTQMGDRESAAIMQDVLEDEITHVRHGVRAFEQWRNPEESFWEAYKKSLPYPITPARAKGTIYTRTHREKAELPRDFIDRLHVYSHSRGRPPVVRVFNPGTEAALGLNTEGYTPNRQVLALARDLEMIPMVLGATDDVVLVRTLPTPEHLAKIQGLGLPVPEFLEAPLDEKHAPPHHPIRTRQFSGVAPWGWDPTIAEFLKPMESQWVREQPPFSHRVERQRTFASKAWLAGELPGLLESVSPYGATRMITGGLPTRATTLAGCQEAIVTHHQVGTGWVVCKAPFGTAGRDAIRMEEGNPLDSGQKGWLQRTLKNQGEVVVEPWYDRVMDLSFQFRVRPDQTVVSEGITRFFTDARGQYLGSLVGPLGVGLSPELRRFVFECPDPKKPWMHHTLSALGMGLGERLAQAGFHGRAGMDAMVVRMPDGTLQLRAPLELNPRPTMGHIALGVAKPWGSRATVLWTFLRQPDLRRTQTPDLPTLLGRLQDNLPTLENLESGPPRQGVFPLNDPVHAAHVLGIIAVAKTLEEVQEAWKKTGLSPL